MAADVAIVVVSWNTRELLLSCLDALHADVEAGRAEVFVVDNASADGSAAAAAEHAPWATVLALEENLGFGAAVNLAAARTDAAWLAPANADIAVAPEALSALLAAGRRHASAGALAPRLVLPGGDVQHSVHPFPTVAKTLAFNAGLARVVPGLGATMGLEGFWRGEQERLVDWAHGAFLLVRRSAWDSVGGFDAAQWLYAEDLDLGWRLHQAGWSTVYVPSAEVTHHVSAATSQAFGDDRVVRAQARAYTWMLRRRGALRTRTVAGANLLGALARIAWLRPAARVRPGRYAPRLQATRTWARAHRTGLVSRKALLRRR